MADNKKIDDKKKRLLTSIGIMAFVLTLAGGTFAYLLFGMNVLNGNYISKTDCFDIVYDNKNNDGTMDITGTLMPSNDYSGGISGSMSIGSSCNVGATGNLIIHLNSNSSLLTKKVEAHCEDAKTLETLDNYNTEEKCNSINNTVWVTNGSALKYMVLEDGITDPVSVGYLNKTSEDIKLYKDFRIQNKTNEQTGETELSKYTVYIWLDAKISDSTYSDSSLSGYMYADATSVDLASIPNAPELDDAMIPVTIANDGSLKTVSPDDSSWYDYANKEWANVVLVADEERREYYLSNLSKNVSVDTSDVVEYYVWIPRYKYKIPSNIACSDIKNPTYERYPSCYDSTYTLLISEEEAVRKLNGYVGDVAGVDEMEVYDSLPEEILNGSGVFDQEIWEYIYIEDFLNEEDYEVNAVFNKGGLVVGELTSIDILFENQNDKMLLGTGAGGYRSHSAFWIDNDNDNYADSNEMLSGIWYSKFEVNASKCEYDEDWNLKENNAVVLPNITGGECINFDGEIGQPYDVGLGSFERLTSGNKEWGAVAYLSESKYGNLTMSSNSSWTTGCGYSTDSNACADAYGSGISTYSQSTTGNITGIFDMNGGLEENMGCSGINDFTGEMGCNGGICYGYGLDEISAAVNMSDPGSGCCYRSSLFTVNIIAGTDDTFRYILRSN